MEATRNQRTIAAPAAMQGVGYWSGRDVRVEFRPAPANTGIVFVRRDLEGCPRIPATVDHRVETPRRTVLRRDRAGVEMIEHIMAALAGLQDRQLRAVGRSTGDARLRRLLPAVCRGFAGRGRRRASGPRRRQVIRRVIHLGNEESWIEARPCRSDKMVLRYELDYGSGNPIGRQSLEISLSPRHFHLNLAPSRTFVLESEAAAIKAQGLGQRATFKDLLVFGPRGPIENQLRFPDECVRHKMVDMVGDLALAGCDLVGRFVAYRSGHRLNAELVRAIAAERTAEPVRRCA